MAPAQFLGRAGANFFADLARRLPHRAELMQQLSWLGCLKRLKDDKDGSKRLS
jgi:hypothetical protein